MILDFVIFGIVRSTVSAHSDRVTTYGAGTWLTLGATIALFIAQIIAGFAYWGSKREKKGLWQGRRRGAALEDKNYRDVLAMGAYGDGKMGTAY